MLKFLMLANLFLIVVKKEKQKAKEERVNLDKKWINNYEHVPIANNLVGLLPYQAVIISLK